MARRASPEAGFTLVEVIVSVLLVAIMATSFMSIALTSRTDRGRLARRAAADASVRRVAESLSAYVTADRTLARGPGSGFDGWTLPGDSSGLRALDAGHHPLDPSAWAPALEEAGGTIAYDVTVRATPSGPQPTVAFRVDWSEP